jgi:glycosyltransferase involved in cell wall biosynthesis
MKPDELAEATGPPWEQIAGEMRPFGLAVRYIAATRTQGPAGARNAGWHAARAPVIAFTDDDTVPDIRWLSAGLAALADGAAAAAGAIVVPLPPHPTDYERDASGLARTEFATANAFVRRAFLSMTGGFDERFTAAWREDSDLQFTLLQAGARVVRAENAVVVHPVRPASWGVSLAQQKKSRFEALLFRKHRNLYRQHIRAVPPLLYYAVLCAALCACAGALAGRYTAAAMAFGIWAVLTGGFCVRRLRGTRHDLAHIAEMAWTSILIPFFSIFWRLHGAIRYEVLSL